MTSPATTNLGLLAGKVAIVTGGARRIGHAISLALAEAGAAVVVNTKNNIDNANQTVREIEEAGGQGLACLADVTDPASVKAMVDAALRKFGRIDILVHNAVARNMSRLSELTLESWHETLAVVVDGAFLCAQACAPELIKNQGSIVFIGGLSAHRGSVALTSSTTKGAIVGMTRSLATDLAPAVTVNCVAPGRIVDENYERRVAHGVAKHRNANAGLVGRDGTPEDIASAVATLCSPRSRYITGQVLHVNGGAYFGG